MLARRVGWSSLFWPTRTGDDAPTGRISWMRISPAVRGWTPQDTAAAVAAAAAAAAAAVASRSWASCWALFHPKSPLQRATHTAMLSRVSRQPDRFCCRSYAPEKTAPITTQCCRWKTTMTASDRAVAHKEPPPECPCPTLPGGICPSSAPLSQSTRWECSSAGSARFPR